MSIKITTAGRFLPMAVLMIGVMGVSSGAIFARLAGAHPLVKCAYRLGLASLVLIPFAFIFHRHEYKKLTRRDFGLVFTSGFFLALHFATWITSLDYTTVASSVMLVNTIPIWVALINLGLGRSRPTSAMWFCILLSVAGAAIVGYGDLSFKGEALYGDLLALAGAVCVSIYILCGREVRAKLTLMPYIALCYGTAAVLLWCSVFALRLDFRGFTGLTWGAFWGMALLAQVVGHSSYNWALRYFSAGFVSIALLGEPVGSAILAYFLFDEVPGPLKMVGFVLLLVSIVISARSEN